MGLYIVLSALRCGSELIDKEIAMFASKFIKGCMVLTTTLTIAACASAPAPTHRWASTEDVDRARYAQDHARCQADANISVTASELETNSSAFAKYKQCMNNNGYVLTAYNN